MSSRSFFVVSEQNLAKITQTTNNLIVRPFVQVLTCEALESVMCDVTKIRLKRRDERRSGKGNPKKRDG